MGDTLNTTAEERKRASHFNAIIEYYDHTWFDYSWIWFNRRNLAVHFGYYDAAHRRHRHALENLNRVLADHASVGEGDTVLDAGCGIAGSAIWLAENRGADVVGITPVQSQVARGNRNIARRGMRDRARVVRGDYAGMDFADGSFDVVWALESLCHALSKPRVYQEFFRVLKPGGRLVIAEYMRDARPLSVSNEKLIKDWLSSWAIPDIDTDEEHGEAAKQAGFDSVEIRDVTPNVRRSLRRLYGLTLVGRPLDRLLKKAGFRRRSANVIGAYKQYLALRENAWHYSILTAQKPR